MADVILESVWKTYSGGVTAVRDLELHVKDGELLVIVGPSGCGKTTTLRLIAGLESPDEGLIRIDGRVVNHLQPRDRNIAMVVQEFSLYPHMTVRQNMSFALKVRGVKKADRDDKVRTAADALGISDVLDRKPGELSGGQRQRAALGKALVLRPKCFLLDEPLSNLDATLRASLRAQIRTLQRQISATMIHVTHDQEEAMMLGDRIAVMRDGTVEQLGTPMELHECPVNRFVAGFFGSPAMNFVPGVLKRDGSSFVFTDGREMRVPIPPSRVVLIQHLLDQPVLAGIRPRQLRDALDGEDHHVPIWTRVDRIEPLGDQVLLHTQTSSNASLLAIVDARHRYEVDRHATLCVDPEKVHLFECDDEQRHLYWGMRGLG